MKIAILADPLTNQNAGIHYFTKALVENLALVNTQNEYYIITEKPIDLPQSLKQIVVKSSVNIIFRAFRMLITIPIQMRRLKIDAVVEPAHFGPFNLPKKMKRISIIHDLSPILFPQYHLWHSQILQRIFLKGILKRAHYIITNSEYTKNDIENYYPFTKNKVTAIYLGNDLKNELMHHPKESIELPQKYFLFVGTIEPRKNLKTLLDAFEKFKMEDQKDFKLVLVGDMGWKSNSFLKQLKRCKYRDEIIQPGYVRRMDLINYYKNAIACIMPSYYEGFGMTIVESMSCGTPCIVSDISSLPEIGGDAVLKFDPNCSEELKNQMIEICKPEVQRNLVAKSLKRSSQFDWSEYAIAFDQLLTKSE